jgi:DNA primase
VAGRIRDADIALVRERSPIGDVVSQRVTLRSAGGGSLKGLCPFHEEKTPSFHVTPTRGFYHCFGCGEGGDVISFVMRTELLPFTEAVEWLASRAGVQLTYEEGGPSTDPASRSRASGQRRRLIAAHQAAEEFYAEQLAGPDAREAREFLAARGFDRAAAQAYGCGFAPGGWDTLTRHLRGRGFSTEEMVVGGLSREGRSGGLIDRFRGRLLWPIRDVGGDPIGFGARKLPGDTSDAPKYLNTPETPLYRKGQVLYGLDLAKREIATKRQAVVVEGYTDVMACHLAGVTTAVATCGTAFGADHVGVLRRLLMDSDEFRGEVIFTFDGDAAGQKAALRAFDLDDQFTTQTYVAVEPTGLDPCDLRLQHGDQAVLDLVARRRPLFEFAIRAVVNRYDLDTTDGKLAALDAAAPIVAKVRDAGRRQRYAVDLDRYLGLLDERFVLRRVAEHAKGAPAQRTRRDQSAGPARPDPTDPALGVQREALKLAVQVPALAGPHFDAVDESAYTHPAYLAIRRAITAVGGAAGGVAGPDWVERLRAEVPAEVRPVVGELAVEPVRADDEPDVRYIAIQLARLQELAVTRQVTELKSRLQRLNPIEERERYARLFGELVALEQYRRGLTEQAAGGL